MGQVSKRNKYDDIRIGGHYNAIHDKYVYEVDYPDGTTEQLRAKIIAKNVLSQVDSEVHHYQVLTEVTYQKRYDSAITKVNDFTKSINGNLHRSRKNHGWKKCHWVNH